MRTLPIILALALNVTFTNRTALANPQTQAQTDSVLICKSKNAHAYHRFECRGLRHCTYKVIKITKAQALKMGYRACKFCYR